MSPGVSVSGVIITRHASASSCVLRLNSHGVMASSGNPMFQLSRDDMVKQNISDLGVLNKDGKEYLEEVVTPGAVVADGFMETAGSFFLKEWLDFFVEHRPEECLASVVKMLERWGPEGTTDGFTRENHYFWDVRHEFPIFLTLADPHFDWGRDKMDTVYIPSSADNFALRKRALDIAIAIRMHHYKGSVHGFVCRNCGSTGEKLVPVLKAMYKGAQVPKGLQPHEAALLLAFHINNKLWGGPPKKTLMHRLFMVFCEMWQHKKDLSGWEEVLDKARKMPASTEEEMNRAAEGVSIEEVFWMSGGEACFSTYSRDPYKCASAYVETLPMEDDYSNLLEVLDMHPPHERRQLIRALVSYFKKSLGFSKLMSKPKRPELYKVVARDVLPVAVKEMPGVVDAVMGELVYNLYDRQQLYGRITTLARSGDFGYLLREYPSFFHGLHAAVKASRDRMYELPRVMRDALENSS